MAANRSIVIDSATDEESDVLDSPGDGLASDLGALSLAPSSPQPASSFRSPDTRQSDQKRSGNKKRGKDSDKVPPEVALLTPSQIVNAIEVLNTQIQDLTDWEEVIVEQYNSSESKVKKATQTVLLACLKGALESFKDESIKLASPLTVILPLSPRLVSFHLRGLLRFN